MNYEVGDKVIAVTDGGYGNVEEGTRGVVTNIVKEDGRGLYRVWFGGDDESDDSCLMYTDEIEKDAEDARIEALEERVEFLENAIKVVFRNA